jgi:hypothetical protein
MNGYRRLGRRRASGIPERKGPRIRPQGLVQRFNKSDHMPTNFEFVIPGRRSEAEANPESSNHRPGLLESGFSTRGLRPTVSPRNDGA